MFSSGSSGASFQTPRAPRGRMAVARCRRAGRLLHDYLKRGDIKDDEDDAIAKEIEEICAELGIVIVEGDPEATTAQLQAISEDSEKPEEDKENQPSKKDVVLRLA